MLSRVLWCPEEDVELFIFLFIYSYLFLFKNIKAVPKAVLIYASDQSDVFWLAPKAGRVRKSASGPELPLVRNASNDRSQPKAEVSRDCSEWQDRALTNLCCATDKWPLYL